MVVSGPFQELKFYNGTITVRYYFDPLHEYFRVADNGELIRLDGVTTVSHIVDKSNMLVPWGCKMMAEELLRIVPVQEANGIAMLEPMDIEEFTKYVTSAKSAHKNKLEEAANIGHTAHAWLEDYIKVRLGLKEASYLKWPEDEKAKNCVQAALDWMQKHNVRWISTENKVFSKEFNYAGTMDGAAWTDSCDDIKCCPVKFKDHRSLIDWKSSNYLYIEYLYQTAAYQHAEEEEHDYKYDDRWLIRLGKTDGKFEKWHLLPEDYEDDWYGFKLCLDLYRTHHKVEDRMKVRKAFVKDEHRREKRIAKIQAQELKKAAREAKKAEKEAIKAKKLLDKQSKK